MYFLFILEAWKVFVIPTVLDNFHGVKTAIFAPKHHFTERAGAYHFDELKVFELRYEDRTSFLRRWRNLFWILHMFSLLSSTYLKLNFIESVPHPVLLRFLGSLMDFEELRVHRILTLDLGALRIFDWLEIKQLPLRAVNAFVFFSQSCLYFQNIVLQSFLAVKDWVLLQLVQVHVVHHRGVCDEPGAILRNVVESLIFRWKG